MARPPFIDAYVLRMAMIGYAQEQAKIEAQIAEIRAQLGNRSLAVTDGVAPKKRKMSAAAKKRISEATRKRWQAFRAAKAEAQKPAEKPKRKMSAARRAALIANLKKARAAKAKKAA